MSAAAARVALVELTSTSTALIVSKFMPYVVAGALTLWMSAYGHRTRRRGEAQQAAAQQSVVQSAAVQAATSFSGPRQYRALEPAAHVG